MVVLYFQREIRVDHSSPKFMIIIVVGENTRETRSMLISSSIIYVENLDRPFFKVITKYLGQSSTDPPFDHVSISYETTQLCMLS